MSKHKQIVKDLKRPDQFVDFWTHAWNRIVAVLGPRQKPAIAVAVAIVVVLVGASIINYWEGNHHQDASRKLARIQDISNAELLTDVADAPKGEIPRFKTAAERAGAVLKELDQFLGGGATAGLKDEALVVKGSTLLGLARYDDAAAAFQGALDAKLEARFRFLAHEGLGYAFEGKGDLDKALAEFGKLSPDSGGLRGFYDDRALYQKARLTALKGDNAGAVALYRQILTKVPDTGLKDEITDRLALIEAK